MTTAAEKSARIDITFPHIAHRSSASQPIKRATAIGFFIRRREIPTKNLLTIRDDGIEIAPFAVIIRAAMHVLFVHQNFPAQFGHIASHLATKMGWKCTFVSEAAAGTTGGIERIQYKLSGGATKHN